MIAGLLKDSGHSIGEDGDISIVNTCVVKTPTERKIIKRLKDLEKQNKKVIVTGCMPAAMPEFVEHFKKFSFIGTNVFDIVKAVDSVRNNERFIKILDVGEKVCVPKIRHNPVIEIVPIAEGCTGACSYCITRLARGKLKSYKKEKILKQIENALKDNVKEIWITAQDTGAYGIDIDSNLPELLNAISDLDGNFRVRVGMMNPNHVLNIVDDLIESYKNEKIYKFLHIPVQSGDDNILKHMGRQYSVDDFRGIIKEFRDKVNPTISTDIIAGYPTESEDEFQNSINFIEEVKPDVLNITRFWSRPNTRASKLKELPGRVTKDRSRRMNRLFEKIGLEKNKKWISWGGLALVSEKNDGTYTARNDYYKPIIIKPDQKLLGKFVNVEIEDATYYDLRGKIIGYTV